MAIISKGEQAREIINTLSARGQSLPCFCTESVYTTEAVFMGAEQFRKETGMRGRLPLIIAFTASYNDRQQLKNYTGLGDFREGMLAAKSDIERLARDKGPFHNLDVIVHLDHAQPGQDDWIIEEYGDFIASVMWDCSHYSMKDNIAMMKTFTEKYRTKFLIEGAVDEIYNYSAGSERLEVIDEITDPLIAEEYIRLTGCDLIVANLGTEHRRTEGSVKYHRDTARKISQHIGRKLVLHGTSSLKREDLESLAEDGIVKVNLWGKLESDPGKKLAEALIKNLENHLSTQKIRELVRADYLGASMLKLTGKPSIKFLTEKYRRDEIYLPSATEIVIEFYRLLYR